MKAKPVVFAEATESEIRCYLLQVAAHEAAHTITAEAHGRRVLESRVVFDRSTGKIGGYTRYDGRQQWQLIASRWDGWAMTNYAGAVIEDLLIHGPDGPPRRPKYADLRKIDGAKDDLVMVETSACHHLISNYKNRVTSLTVDFVVENIQAIMARTYTIYKDSCTDSLPRMLNRYAECGLQGMAA